jgi:hypothetical protein
MLASFFSPHMTIGDLIVGIGTLALAVLTGCLAWQTKRTADVAAASIELEQQGLEAAKQSAAAANASAKAAMIEVDALTLPFVVLTPDPTKTLTNPRVAPAPIRRVDNTHVEAQLLNIGAGAAIVTGVSIVGDGGELLDQSAQPQRPLAAQGYDNVRLQTTNTWLSVGAQLTMSIKYQAPDGRRLQTVTMASLQGNGNDIVCHSFARRADEVPQSR